MWCLFCLFVCSCLFGGLFLFLQAGFKKAVMYNVFVCSDVCVCCVGQTNFREEGFFLLKRSKQ